jgi:GTP:adenosylcobinamide-phosphate guanylyltransferase
MKPAIPDTVNTLKDVARLTKEKILNPESLDIHRDISSDVPVLVILVAGKGTRFGNEPKCIQPVNGIPLARHSIDAFRRFSPSQVICIVGYRHNDVRSALGSDNTYVLSENSSGGTAYASIEAFSVHELLEKNPLLIITMGDRIVPSSVFRNLWNTHNSGDHEADLTLLTAIYEPPKNRGKGRILRDKNSRVVQVMEERDIVAEEDPLARQAHLNLTEGNCPLYAVRAVTLYRHLQNITNANAQWQYYLTDIIESISKESGVIRTITTTVNEPEYDLLCSDVTQPIDLAMLEGILASNRQLLIPEEVEAEEAADLISAGRPAGQVASIARQLGELITMINREKLSYEPGDAVGIGISGGRLRIAFMHPDMVRFFGPAWQMPIGAGNEKDEEQIVVLIQGASDGRIHLFPMDPQYRESINSIPADNEAMYPGEEISDMYTYEKFGTRMSEGLLLSLGYFSDMELEERRIKNQPLPPSSLWVSSNLRRPFALVGNAIASLRTLRSGNLGAKVQECLGKDTFRGLRLVSAGNIPQGGFSSSSAVTVATKNAINSLFNIGISPDLLVHLACQAEYGTGVRAGSLDQATEQKGRAGQGTLISSNPKDNYRILGTYPIPADRFQIIFPYSVERDRNAWRWSCGTYGSGGTGSLTTSEIRKMTGKAAEIASIIVRLPIETDFFKQVEDDLVTDGLLSIENRRLICLTLLQIPLLISQEDLEQLVYSNRDWYIGQLIDSGQIDKASAGQKADTTLKSLFAGWRNPVLRRTTGDGSVVEENGVPLRAMVAYLYGEVAKNFYLIHHPDHWIEFVTRSQRGDCCFNINPDRLPSTSEMTGRLEWERGADGPDLLNLWMEKCSATPFNYNRGIDDESLSATKPPEFHYLEGSGFFRGLALIDLAEAMLKRAFGSDTIAIRVNAAGQGDYFQVHLDTQKINPEDVKNFLRKAFYSRFSLKPDHEFVEIHPGGGAAGLRLNRYDTLPMLVQRLRYLSSEKK